MRATTDEASETWGEPETTSSAVTDVTPNAAEINSRYGRTPGARRRNRLWAWIAGGSFVVVLGAWLLWAGILENADAIESQNIAHTVISDREVDISWQLNAAPGTSTSCALQALNESFAIVGWKIVEIPPSDQRTRSLTESVLTSEQSVTGLIYSCWLS